MSKTHVVTRKIKLTPIGDSNEVSRIYKYLRNGMEVQSIMLNQYMSALYTAHMHNASLDELKEINRLYGRVPGSSKGSAYDFDVTKYPTGLPLAADVKFRGNAKFKDACKKGLMYGKISLPTFKKDNPLMVHNRYVNIRGKSGRNTGMYYDYSSPADFLDALYSVRNPEVYINFANGIKFKLNFGDFKHSMELRKTIERCFNEEYRICDSQIGLNDKKIILYLSVEMPVQEFQLDENVVVGVDLGLAVPAVCSLNNNKYVRLNIGSYEEFTHKRAKIQAMRRSLNSNIKSSKGGHGRIKKLKRLETFKKYERNFVQTYNHYVSRQIVDFALKNHAKYINIEDLSGFSKEERNSFVLRNWSYFELQSMIEYKAAMYGIVVRKVVAAYTSQVCSICGHRGIRDKQSEFVCTNPDCDCTKIYGSNKFGADFNGSRNIAMSNNFVDDVKSNKDLTIVSDFEKDGVVLLKSGETYHHSIVMNTGVIKVLCDDAYWHEFDSIHDLDGIVEPKDVSYIMKSFEKKSKKKTA